MNNLRELTVSLAFCAFLLGTGCRQHSSPEKAAQPPAKMRFPVARNGEPILLPIKWQGRNLSFLLDTGAQFTCFDATLLLGEPKSQVRLNNANRQAILAVYPTPQAFLGDYDLRDSVKSVIGLDLTAARENNGLEIYGILGMDFLSHHVLQVDPDAGECLFFERNPEPIGAPFGIEFRNDLPFLRASLANYGELVFLLDTGSFGLVSGSLEKPVWSELVEKARMRPNGSLDELTAFGFVKTDLAQGGLVVLGDQAVLEPMFFRFDQSILGLGFLSRFQFTFDFPNKVIYLDKGRSYDRRDGRDLSGMSLLRKHGKTSVRLVRKGSPADLAGVRTSDLLFEIDGHDANQLSMFQLRRLFSRKGSITVTLRRTDGKPYTSALILKE